MLSQRKWFDYLENTNNETNLAFIKKIKYKQFFKLSAPRKNKSIKKFRLISCIFNVLM